jgi:plastocyanin
MSYRKRMHRQRQLERKRSEETFARWRLLRNVVIGAVATAGVIAVAVGGFVFLPGGSSEEPAASVGVSMGDNFFDPPSVNIKAGQMTMVTLYNAGRATHNLWSSGPDTESGTGDDFRSADIAGGELGSIDVKFDQPGSYGFSCTFHGGQGGRFVVEP